MCLGMISGYTAWLRRANEAVGVGEWAVRIGRDCIEGPAVPICSCIIRHTPGSNRYTLTQVHPKIFVGARRKIPSMTCGYRCFFNTRLYPHYVLQLKESLIQSSTPAWPSEAQPAVSGLSYTSRPNYSPAGQDTAADPLSHGHSPPTSRFPKSDSEQSSDLRRRSPGAQGRQHAEAFVDEYCNRRLISMVSGLASARVARTSLLSVYIY